MPVLVVCLPAVSMCAYQSLFMLPFLCLQMHRIREFYQNVVPNKHIASLHPHKPCYLHGFSPCGRYLVGFGRDLDRVLIFMYRGLPNLDREQAIKFETMFTLIHEVVHDNAERTFGLLDRVALFFHGMYVVVSSTGQDANYVEPDGQWLGIEDMVTFHAIHLESGEIVDRVAIVAEGLDISLPNALATYESRLVVLSTRSLVLLDFEPNGKFSNPEQIGKYCYPDDDEAIRKVHGDGALEGNAHYCSMLDGLKQRLLTHMYLDALESNQDPRKSFDNSESISSGNPMSSFYYFFRALEKMELNHAHFLDKDRLLLSWSVDLTMPTAQAMPEGLKAIYNMRTTLFEKVFDIFDPKEFNEWFKKDPNMSNTSCPSSLWEQFSLDGLRGQHSWLQHTALSRGIPPLIPCQRRQTSPYLDKELFQYDDKSVSRDSIPVSAVRFRTAKFIAHAWPSNLKFALDIEKCLHLSSSEHNENDMMESIRRNIHLLYIFHPFEPVVFSAVQTYEEYHGEAEVLNVFAYT